MKLARVQAKQRKVFHMQLVSCYRCDLAQAIDGEPKVYGVFAVSITGTASPGTMFGDGNEVFFRIKRSTQLRKLMNAYCERQSVDPNSIAFLFDGRRLRAEQTPAELEMEEGDEIDAMLHQTGGFSL
ncbi:hypothetical protein L7F22_000268 [Adiantum nelumboides]|nr:hypothetical protein [Adiantum nelumboides]